MTKPHNGAGQHVKHYTMHEPHPPVRYGIEPVTRRKGKQLEAQKDEG